jgi:hypothetical protein
VARWSRVTFCAGSGSFDGDGCADDRACSIAGAPVE